MGSSSGKRSTTTSTVMNIKLCRMDTITICPRCSPFIMYCLKNLRRTLTYKYQDQSKARVLKRRKTFRRVKSKFVQRQSSRQLLMLASKQIKSRTLTNLKAIAVYEPSYDFCLKQLRKFACEDPRVRLQKEKDIDRNRRGE